MRDRRFEDYDQYVKGRARSAVRSLLTKVAMHVNTSLNFSWRLRAQVYRWLGVRVANPPKGLYIAREVLLDDNFPELITIGDGAVLSWRVVVLCHNTLTDKKVVGH